MSKVSAKREISFSEAIREGFDQSLARDENVILIGLGVPDLKAIFGTTKGLQEKYGSERVMDMPLSENGMTGICIGAALAGLKPVLVHQRIDFSLLALDQIINNAAKWQYMYQRKENVPIVIRVLIGRGWGQGPQHSQSLQALYAHIPGLKVVMPAVPYDAKGMLISAIEDEGPVIFIEHRWVHHFKDHVPEEPYTQTLSKARVVRQGTKITVAAFSYMVIESLRAAESLASHGIDLEVIDMRSCRPLDINTVSASLAKTGKLIVSDTGWAFGGIASELISSISENHFDLLTCKPVKIASPDYPVPTSPAVANDYYPDAVTIAFAALDILDNHDKARRDKVAQTLKREGNPDQPHPQYFGPF